MQLILQYLDVVWSVSGKIPFKVKFVTALSLFFSRDYFDSSGEVQEDRNDDKAEDGKTKKQFFRLAKALLKTE